MKVGIISLGLIGSSILKSLSDKGFNLVCVTRNQKSIKKAKEYNACASNDIATLKDCEIVFVCSPISKTIEMLDKLENIVNKDCIVLDTASVKEFVMQRQRPYKFIGSHPMAGTVNSGFDAGLKELFEGAKWILCPQKNIEENDITKVKTLIEKIGAQVILSNPKDHDRAVALISHMPMFVAQALFETIKNNDFAKKLASSGFRDMTRLAMSNIQMAEDMINYNQENIEFALNMLKNECENLKKDYKKKIEKIAKDRNKMYSKDGKNIL